MAKNVQQRPTSNIQRETSHVRTTSKIQRQTRDVRRPDVPTSRRPTSNVQRSKVRTSERPNVQTFERPNVQQTTADCRFLLNSLSRHGGLIVCFRAQQEVCLLTGILATRKLVPRSGGLVSPCCLVLNRRFRVLTGRSLQVVCGGRASRWCSELCRWSTRWWATRSTS